MAKTRLKKVEFTQALENNSISCDTSPILSHHLSHFNMDDEYVTILLHLTI